MTEFVIIGAGMAGLLAGHMLGGPGNMDKIPIYEAQPTLPNNHNALLRFRSSVVGDTLGIPFKSVQVMKGVDRGVGNPVGDTLSYALKTTGTAGLRSIVTANGEIEERFIAPPDLISRMANGLDIRTGVKITHKEIGDFLADGKKIISTVPLPTIFKIIFDEPAMPEFKSALGIVSKTKLYDTNVYATIYFPHKGDKFYRASMTGDELIIEYAFPNYKRREVQEIYEKMVAEDQPSEDLLAVTDSFGISRAIFREHKISMQNYAKILPIDDSWRKKAIMKLSDRYDIYSLGRFATWRPGLLMDDLVNDVRVIQTIAENGNYDHRRSI